MMMARPRNLEELQGSLRYSFRDEALLRAALTHSSYAHEKKGAVEGDNERLEFLGDAVFGLAAARCLCEQYPVAEEGELTRIRAILVREKWLAACLAEDDYRRPGPIRFAGKSEENRPITLVLNALSTE